MVFATQHTHDPSLRIQALGRFLVTTRQAPDGVRTRSRSKPLELLKLISVQCGEGLSVETAMDALWPDADGDHARWSFATTLRRLRGIVGNEAVQLHSARLTLSRQHSWLDANIFAEKLDASAAAMSAGKTHRAVELLHDALQLYRGPLLAGESDLPLVILARERLHNSLLRQVQGVGGLLEKEGAEEQAIALYQQALEADPGAEWLYQALLRLLPQVGRHSEAIAIYERCHRNLKAHLDIQPGPETEALRQALGGTVTEGIRQKPSLAILPFDSHLPENAYFASGIAYELRTMLLKFSGLVMLGHPATPGQKTMFKGNGEGPHQQPDFVVTGSVRRHNTRVRITAALTESGSGKQVWGERFECADDNLVSMFDGIAEEIVTKLRVELVEGEQAFIWSRALRDPRARDRFYQGLEHFWRMTPERLAMSREQFLQVIELEPGSTIGYGYTAWTHLFELLHGYSTEPGRSLGLAKEYCEQAAKIDVDGLSVHLVRSHLHLLKGEEEQAIACLEASRKLRPGCGVTYAMYAHTLLHLGRPREAIGRMQMAFRLTPQCPPWYHEVLGWAYLICGFHEQAAAAACNALQSDFARVEPQLLLAAAMHAQGRTADAHACIEGLRRQHPDIDPAALLAAKPCRGPELLGPALAWV